MIKYSWIRDFQSLHLHKQQSQNLKICTKMVLWSIAIWWYLICMNSWMTAVCSCHYVTGVISILSDKSWVLFVQTYHWFVLISSTVNILQPSKYTVLRFIQKLMLSHDTIFTVKYITGRLSISFKKTVNSLRNIMNSLQNTGNSLQNIVQLQGHWQLKECCKQIKNTGNSLKDTANSLKDAVKLPIYSLNHLY